MPVYNGANYVDQAVRSILEQSFTDFEFLIIDDASTDGTVDRLSAYTDRRINLVRNARNLGLTKSLNQGLAVARAPLVARQDADDVSWPRRLERQVAFLDEHPNVAVVGTQANVIDDGGRRIGTVSWVRCTTELGLRWQLLFDSPFVHTSVVFRRDIIWNQFGGYDEAFVTGQDFELWSRVGALHALRNLADTLVDFRVHRASLSGHYTENNVRKIHAVLTRNAEMLIGTPPIGWPDLWIRFNNPSLFGPVDSSEVISAVDRIHQRFMYGHSEAAADREVRRHMASLMMRIADRETAYDRRRSLRIFVRAVEFDRQLAASGTLHFVARFLGGQRLRRRHGAHSSTPRQVGD